MSIVLLLSFYGIQVHKVAFLNFWRDILCNLRTEFMRDLLLFGKEIKIFMQTV